jgi:hypothetical protein
LWSEAEPAGRGSVVSHLGGGEFLKSAGWILRTARMRVFHMKIFDGEPDWWKLGAMLGGLLFMLALGFVTMWIRGEY